MKKNIGTFDRILRVIIGLTIILLGLIYQNWLGLIGLVPLLTAAVGICPLYTVFGISTCKTQ